MKVSELFLKEEVDAMYLVKMNLTSLDGLDIPDKVNGNFSCGDNDLTSLEGCPKEVTANFTCNKNPLTSLEGCPSKVGGEFYCIKTGLTSLQGIHKLFKGGYIKGTFNCQENRIESHILGLLLIPELKRVKVNEVSRNCYDAFEILSKHLEGDKDVIECQQELIEAGLKAFAQL